MLRFLLLGPWLSILLRPALDDGHGEPRDTHQPFVLVTNLDVPHVTAPAEMKGARGRGDASRGDAAQMVGVDLLPDAQVAFRIDAQHGSDAADGLCESHRSAAMQ